MRVKCTGLKQELGKDPSSSVWLKIGAVYEVICLTFDAHSKAVYARIVGEQPAIPAVHAIEQFEIIDSRMPATWEIFGGKNGGFFIGPAPWAVPGFWEKFFDRDATARQIFEVELSKLRATK